MFILRPRPLSLTLAFLTWPRPAAAAPMTMAVRAGEVVRGRASRWRPSTLTVTSGTLWLTTSPADGDIVLRAGESMQVTRPWLAEAVDGQAGVTVRRG